nr:metallophosphoesterase [Roseospira navarrensis]
MEEPKPGVLRRVLEHVPDEIDTDEEREGEPQSTFQDGFIIHQISDLHFGQFSEEIGNKWLCEYYLDFLRTLPPRKRPHVVVICGDLTSFGLDKEFVDAARFVQQLKGSAGQNGSALLQPLYTGSEPDCAKQIVVVPGNHDVTWREQRSDGEAAIRPFKKFLDITQVLTPLAPCPAVHFEPVSVTIVACNSAHLGGVDVPAEYLSMPPELRQEHGPALSQVLREIRRVVEENAAMQQGKSDAASREKALKDIIRFTWGYVDPAFLNQIREKAYPFESGTTSCGDRWPETA